MMSQKNSFLRRSRFLLLTSLFGLVACSDDDDLSGPQPTDATVNVQDFMWKAMNEWYFWQADVPDLADNRFANDSLYTAFLQLENDPEQFIGNILFSEDRFTFYNEDYNVLLNSLSGVSKTNGMQFFIGGLANEETDNVYGFIRNVVPGSNAAEAGLRRGDVFYAVDGQQLNDQNFSALLFGDNDTYTLSMGELDPVTRLVNPTQEQVTLTKIADFLEPPIRLSKTLDINGQKIGYLMYQRFNRNFDEELNDVFGKFVADGVTDLVLDLRYNPGGSVNTSRLLASMIYGRNEDDLYIRQRWNNKQQERFSKSQLEDYFEDQLPDGTTLNTLNLTRLFVLATGRSASASELLINGLNPYIDVIHIGDTTRGKNEFSISLVDDSDNRYRYSQSRENRIDPDNSWIIQPLVGRNENALGFLDYTAGFTPDIPIREDVFNLGQFGDANEPLLAQAIAEITGSGTVARKTLRDQPQEQLQYDTPAPGLMLLDKPLLQPE
ncbi:MAG: S41 family peptidase [Bacteroidota bacterium]